MYKVRVNKDDDKILNIFDFNVSDFANDPVIRIQSDDLKKIKEIFYKITSIEIYRDVNIIAEYTAFDSYADIVYMGKAFCSEDNVFSDCLAVRLTRMNIIEQIQRIDEKVNPVIDEDSMTINELKQRRIDQICKAGEADIFSGDQVTFDDGATKTYTFGLDDQNNLQTYLSLIAQIQDKTKIAIPYHAVGEVCQNYTAKQIVTIYFTLQIKLLRVYTYVNMLRLHITSMTDIEDVRHVQYGVELPEQYKEQMNMIISESIATIMEIKKQYDFDDTEAVDQNNEEVTG